MKDSVYPSCNARSKMEEKVGRKDKGPRLGVLLLFMIFGEISKGIYVFLI